MLGLRLTSDVSEEPYLDLTGKCSAADRIVMLYSEVQNIVSLFC